MKTTLLRLIIAGGALLAFAVAQGAPDSNPKKPKGPSKAQLEKYDANRDGALDAAEQANLKADQDDKKAAEKQARLDKYDKNDDGKVSKDEKVAEDADKAAARAAREAKKAKKEAGR